MKKAMIFFSSQVANLSCLFVYIEPSVSMDLLFFGPNNGPVHSLYSKLASAAMMKARMIMGIAALA